MKRFFSLRRGFYYERQVKRELRGWEFFYDEQQVKRELKRIHISGYRCNERLRAKTDGFFIYDEQQIT